MTTDQEPRAERCLIGPPHAHLDAPCTDACYEPAEPVTPTPAEPRERVDHADMRIEVVKRELNQGALAGFDSEVTAYAAQLVVAALDSYDAAALKAEYERGVQHGKVVQTIFGNSVENLQAEYERGIAEGLRRAASTIEDSAARLESTNDNTAAAIRATAVAWIAGLRISAKLAEGGPWEPAPDAPNLLRTEEQPGEPAEQPGTGCPSCRTILNAKAAGCDGRWHADNRSAEQPEPARCCDLHGRNCEQGGEECCWRCTEAFHFKIGHGGVPCSNPDLSAAEQPEGSDR